MNINFKKIHTWVSLISFSKSSTSFELKLVSFPISAASFILARMVFRKKVDPFSIEFRAASASGLSSCSLTLRYNGPVKDFTCVNLSSYVFASALNSSSSQFDI